VNATQNPWTWIGRPLAVILLTYLCFCGVALPWFLHRVGPDAMSYITIAQKYHTGDYRNAVNGYWSPLISWIMAPLLGLGAAPEVIAKCLQVAIGCGTLAAIWWLARQLKVSAAAQFRVTLCLVPAVAAYALSDTTPDLLVAGLLVVYIGVVIGEEYPRSLWQGAACGLLGALAYLAKAYAFPFFLGHFVAVSAYLWLRRRASGFEVGRVVTATLAGLLVFAVLAGGWASLLSRKYSRLTIGTSGSYQIRLGARGQPTEVGGLYAPANDTAISAWEDPSDLIVPPRMPAAELTVSLTAKQAPEKRSTRDWGPFVRLMKRMAGNSLVYSGTLFRLSPLWPFILLGLLVSCVLVPRGPVCDRCTILLGTLLLYSAGYLMIFIHARFFWLITFLLSLSAGLLATTIPILGRKPWQAWWAVATALSFTLWPTWFLCRIWHDAIEETPSVAAQLMSVIPSGSRVASDAEWGLTNSIIFHYGGRYYGMLRGDSSAAEQEQQLREHRVQYLLVWGDPARYPFLELASEVPVGQVSGLRLARVPRVFELTTGQSDAEPAQPEGLEHP